MNRPWIAIALVGKIIRTINSIYHTEITCWCKGLTCGKLIYTKIIEASMINTNNNHAIIKNRCGKNVINLIFTCLINYILFDCNDVGRKLRWSLKEFNLSWPLQGSCLSANLKCPGELRPTQTSFGPPLFV